MGFPAFLEQALLGELRLRIDDDDLGISEALFRQHMREHRGALVGAGRTAVRVGRRDHDDLLAVLDGIEPGFQQFGLRTSLPGVRHDLGCLLGIARHGVPDQAYTRRHHQPVVGNAAAVGHDDFPGLPVDGLGHLVDDGDPVVRGELLVVVIDRIEGAVSAQIKVREEAGRVLRIGLDQGDVDGPFGILGDVAGRRRAARPAADDDDLRPPLGAKVRRHRKAQPDGTGQHHESAACLFRHGFLPEIPSYDYCGDSCPK